MFFLLASKFVDITEISLALFMEADAGCYNTEKMELSSRTSIRLCFATWSMLVPNFPSLSLPILPLYSHMRPIFEHNPNHFFHLISATVFLLDPDSEGAQCSVFVEHFHRLTETLQRRHVDSAISHR